MKIKQVSFDVWNTLVVANPTYAAKRAEAIQTFCPQYSKEEIKAVYTMTKKFIDDMAEKYGRGPSTEEAYQRLCMNLGIPFSQVASVAEDIRYVCAALFTEHPPEVHPSAHALVEQLNKLGIEISIASNSNFIPGQLMSKYLNNQLGGVCKYGVYSDAIGSSKPSPLFFETVVLMSKFGPEEILHVGDNHICDVIGALQQGMNVYHVTNQNSMDVNVLQLIATFAANA